eukprot:1158496-Pelagomonas_calceolata.AAC.6
MLSALACSKHSYQQQMQVPASSQMPELVQIFVHNDEISAKLVEEKAPCFLRNATHASIALADFMKCSSLKIAPVITSTHEVAFFCTASQCTANQRKTAGCLSMAPSRGWRSSRPVFNLCTYPMPKRWVGYITRDE